MIPASDVPALYRALLRPRLIEEKMEAERLTIAASEERVRLEAELAEQSKHRAEQLIFAAGKRCSARGDEWGCLMCL